jgi:hypothetical protein
MIMRWLSWLNDNAGAVQAIAAIAAACLAAITLCFIVAYTRYTKKLLRESQRQSKHSDRQLKIGQAQAEYAAKQLKGSFMPVLAVVTGDADKREVVTFYHENQGIGVALEVNYALQLGVPTAQATAAAPIGPNQRREILIPAEQVRKDGLYVNYRDVAGNLYESAYRPGAPVPYTFVGWVKEISRRLPSMNRGHRPKRPKANEQYKPGPLFTRLLSRKAGLRNALATSCQL